MSDWYRVSRPLGAIDPDERGFQYGDGVFETMRIQDEAIPLIERHLAVLRNAGILSSEKRGNQVFYQLRVPCILNFFDCVESVLSEVTKSL